MKYRITKPIELKGSEVGDIVDMNDLAFELNKDCLEDCDQSLSSKHVWVVADPSNISSGILKVNM